MKAAVIQMVSGPRVKENLSKARSLLREAAAQGAQLAVLPENFAVFGGRAYREIAEAEATGSGLILSFLAETAAAEGLWLVAGSVPLLHRDAGVVTPEGRVFAASTLWSPEGQLEARYDKCHLFDVEVTDGVGSYRESDTFIAGDQPVSAALPFGLLGLSICYDLRFPELYRRYARQGAVMMTVPSAFTYKTGEAHWEVLLRARAVENQCFILAANQGGQHSAQRVTWGHSCIIDPWGDVLAMQQSPGEGVTVAELDFTALWYLRTRMPSLSHRQFD